MAHRAPRAWVHQGCASGRTVVARSFPPGADARPRERVHQLEERLLLPPGQRGEALRQLEQEPLLGGRPGRPARAQPLEEVVGLDPERPRECEQPLDADQAGAFFAPVDLLVDGPDPLGELPLGQAERAPPLAQPGRDVAVGIGLRVVPRHVGSRRSRSRREPRRGEGVPGCLPPGPSVGPPRGRLPYRPTGPASLAAAANSLAFRATPYGRRARPLRRAGTALILTSAPIFHNAA